MIYETKHYSEAKFLRYEKKWALNMTKGARIGSKRFNKAERKAAKLALKKHL